MFWKLDPGLGAVGMGREGQGAALAQPPVLGTMVRV